MISPKVNLRGIIAVSIVMIVMMIVHINLMSKEKEDYDQTSGELIYLDKQLGQLPSRHMGKYRYLEVEGYEYPFEIFIGKETGDFKPKFEQIDNLRLGDTITVYYYETEYTRDEGINRYIQFIDKNEDPFFERGNSGVTLGGFIILLCVLLIIGGIVLWRLEKIPF